MTNQTYQNGITVRKQVMGDAHVERAMGQVTPFTAPFLSSMAFAKSSNTAFCQT